jgi:hypothetical protein
VDSVVLHLVLLEKLNLVLYETELLGQSRIHIALQNFDKKKLQESGHFDVKEEDGRAF